MGLAGAPTFSRSENVIVLIKRDHQRVKDMYERYQSASDDIRERQEAVRSFTKDLVQHSEVEQLLVYPLLKMRQNGEEKNQELHDHSLDDHQQIRELLYDLDQTSVTDPSHSEKIKKVMDAVNSHVEEEESVVLPAIEKNFSIEELERIGNAFEKHKYTATTRPHPHAPAQGPLAAAANLLSKPIDMARDAIA